MVRVCNPTIDENGNTVLVLNESVKRFDRIAAAFDLPELLNEKRLLTKEEIESIEYTELEPDKLYRIKGDSGTDYPVAIRMSSQFLQKHGFLDRLAPIRAELLSDDFKSKISGKQAGGGGNGRYLVGLTEMPLESHKTIQVGEVSKAEKQTRLQSTVAELTAIVSEATVLAVPELQNRGQEDQFYKRASLTLGSTQNHIYTSMQFNYMKEGQNMKEELSKFGGIHRDKPNDPSTLAAIVSLSNFSEDYFGGRFNVVSLNVTVPLLPYEIILFPARFFHTSTGVGQYSVPRGSSLRHPSPQAGLVPPLPEGTGFSRLCIPLWASKRLLRPEVRWVNGHIYEDLGLSVFESFAHQNEWMMRFYIVNEPEIILRLEGKTSTEPGSGPQQLIDVFYAAVKSIDKDEITRLTATIPRTGIAEQYVSMFTREDPATGNIVIPRVEEAIKTLNALSKTDNEVYETYWNDMQELVKKLGGNSNRIPEWAKSKSARLRKLRVAKAKDLAAAAAAQELETEEAEDKSKAEGIEDGESVDFGFTELTQWMNQLSAANVKVGKELTGVVAGLSSALQNMIAYAIKTGDNIPASTKKAQTTSNNKKRSAQTELPSDRRDKKQRAAASSHERDLHASLAQDSDMDSEYELESVVAKRPTKSGRPLYRVRWKGWGPEWDEWKTARELEHATDLVDEYERRCDQWNDSSGSAEAGADGNSVVRFVEPAKGSVEDVRMKSIETDDDSMDLNPKHIKTVPRRVSTSSIDPGERGEGSKEMESIAVKVTEEDTNEVFSFLNRLKLLPERAGTMRIEEEIEKLQ